MEGELWVSDDSILKG